MNRDQLVKPARYLFDDVFALDVEPARAAEPGFDRAAHAAEIERARSEGHAAGLAEGRKAAAATAATHSARAAEKLFGRIGEIEARLQAEREELEAAAVELALAAADRLAGTLIAAAPRAEIEAMLRDCLSNLRDVGHVVVRVREDIADDLRGRLAALSAEAGFQGRVVVLADPDVARGDGRIDWADGGIVRNVDDIRRTIAEAARAYLAGRTAPAKDQADE